MNAARSTVAPKAPGHHQHTGVVLCYNKFLSLKTFLGRNNKSHERIISFLFFFLSGGLPLFSLGLRLPPRGENIFGQL